ncbi:MAG: hypothetical protein ACE5EW_08070, partial [Thermoplasmata archaeon]
MANDEQGPKAEALCIVCGSGLRADGQCSSCGALHETVDGKLRVKSDTNGGQPVAQPSPDQMDKEALVAWLKGDDGDLETWIEGDSTSKESPQSSPETPPAPKPKVTRAQDQSKEQ